MSPRKGGIGRKPGKKRAIRQKQKSATSLIAMTMYNIQIQREIEEKLAARRERRNTNVITNISPQSNSHNNENITLQIELYKNNIYHQNAVLD